jgi:hypothetical protein
MYNVEKIKSESIYEYMSWLNKLDKIDEDAAIWMLRTYADSSQYHNRIGREINLRWSDDTGLKHVSNKWSYIKRIFGKEGDTVVDEINKKNIAFSVMSHMLMLTPQLLNKSFGKRVKIIETIRHPLYMVKHFVSYLERYNSSREFTISFYNKEIKIPWFAKEWEEEFLNSNYIERAVLCITKLYPILLSQLEKSKISGLEVLVLSFEDIVFETKLTMEKIELFLGRSHSKNLNKILNNQKIPRKSIFEGIGHSSYGWRHENKPEQEMYFELLNLIRSNCNTNLFLSMITLIEWYENNYKSKLSNIN